MTSAILYFISSIILLYIFHYDIIKLFKKHYEDLKTPISESGPIRQLSSLHKYQPYTIEDKEELGKMPIHLPNIRVESLYQLSICLQLSILYVTNSIFSLYRESVDTDYSVQRDLEVDQSLKKEIPSCFQNVSFEG